MSDRNDRTAGPGDSRTNEVDGANLGLLIFNSIERIRERLALERARERQSASPTTPVV